ncbi:MAG: archaetidylserine decarboxylase [Myxococcota bacterium]
MGAKLLIALVAVLPAHGMSRVAGWLATRELSPWWRKAVFGWFVRTFGANPDEAEKPMHEYPTLNAFFTRALKPGARPVAEGCIVSPVDAAIGASGPVAGDTVVQAKGRDYSLSALLGDPALARELDGGTYATLYLAPKDYHRIHSPLTAEVVKATYIPGALWPVNAAAVANVNQLFAVNERLVVELRTREGGVMALVAVGATMVGMTRVVFDDLHTNARRRVVDSRRYSPPVAMKAGDQVGHFEFGSTVILVCGRSCGTLTPPARGESVRMGSPLGVLASAAAGNVVSPPA